MTSISISRQIEDPLCQATLDTLYSHGYSQAGKVYVIDPPVLDIGALTYLTEHASVVLGAQHAAVVERCGMDERSGRIGLVLNFDLVP